jgi:hypothetical protein
LAQSASVNVAIRVSSQKVRLDQTVPVEVIVSNVSEKDAMVLRGKPAFNEAGGLDLVLIDSAGTRTRVPPTRNERTLDSVRAGSRRAVLAPQTSVVVQRRFRIVDVVSKPGRYALIATYASPLPTSDNRSVIDGELEGARGVSVPVALEVTE